MALTLAEARTIVADHLDDASNDRWTTAQLDIGLKFALGACTDDYAANGGDRLQKVLSTTSDTSGLIDLSSVDPKKILGVALTIGNRFFPVSECTYEERGLNDSSARSFTVRYMPTFTLPTNTGHPIVGSAATAAKTFDSFDNWICSRAALFCSIKDADARQELRVLEQELRRTVMEYPKIPRATAFPDRPHWYSNWFVWAYKPDDQKIQMARRGWF